MLLLPWFEFPRPGIAGNDRIDHCKAVSCLSRVVVNTNSQKASVFQFYQNKNMI